MLVDGGGGKWKLDIRYSRIGVRHSLNISFDSQDVGIAITAGISMRASAKGKVRLSAPVLEVVAALE